MQRLFAHPPRLRRPYSERSMNEDCRQTFGLVYVRTTMRRWFRPCSGRPTSTLGTGRAVSAFFWHARELISGTRVVPDCGSSMAYRCQRSALRNECLTMECFRNQIEVKVVIEDCHHHYDTVRPHSRHGYATAEAFRSKQKTSLFIVAIPSYPGPKKSGRSGAPNCYRASVFFGIR